MALRAQLLRSLVGGMISPRSGRGSELRLRQVSLPEKARTLEELDNEILATTTVGPYESRLQVWRRLCVKWEVFAFPLDHENVRAVGASLKRGRYRSAEQYYSAAASFQARRLHSSVPAHIRACMRDCIPVDSTRLRPG